MLYVQGIFFVVSGKKDSGREKGLGWGVKVDRVSACPSACVSVYLCTC